MFRWPIRKSVRKTEVLPAARGSSMEPEAVLIDAEWTDPYSILDAWVVAKTEGGTLDYDIRGGRMWFTVRFVAPRTVKVRCHGKIIEIPRGREVNIEFNFTETHSYLVPPDEAENFATFIARRPRRTYPVHEQGDEML